MNFIKGIFISKRKLLERIVSLEQYVGAEYVAKGGTDYMYSEHQPDRSPWVKNPIAKLIIEEENKK